MPPGVLCPALESSAQGGHGPIGESPEEAARMLRGLEHLFPEERLRDGIVHPGECYGKT